MKNENLIHIKLENREAIQSKKDILLLERDLLKIVQTIKNYKKLRTEELNIKLKSHRKIKELTTNVTRLQRILPKIEIPDILEEDETSKSNEMDENKETVKKTLKIKAKEKTKKYDHSIESQLKEIQDKLSSLK